MSTRFGAQTGRAGTVLAPSIAGPTLANTRLLSHFDAAILWAGASLLDSAPIVVIATGLGDRASANSKTGAMVQTYILRSDTHPVLAVRSGADAAICGDCPLRPASAPAGAARCYVNHGFGPAAIYRNYVAGGYSARSPREVSARALQLGRPIRLGTYGDPAAVPSHVWFELVSVQTRFTGYTHQWRRLGALALRSLCMASVGSASEAALAQSAGWRTFRVRSAADPLSPSEIVCPASAEAGHRTDCARCGLCAGTTRSGAASVVIIDHGPTAAR